MANRYRKLSEDCAGIKWVPEINGPYNPQHFDDLAVSSKVRDLFTHILDYQPKDVELDHKLAPFIPEYVPHLGDRHAFLHVTKPDGVPDLLGATVLDVHNSQTVKQRNPQYETLSDNEDSDDSTDLEIDSGCDPAPEHDPHTWRDVSADADEEDSEESISDSETGSYEIIHHDAVSKQNKITLATILKDPVSDSDGNSSGALMSISSYDDHC